MTNNDILRRIRYIFDYNDFKMIELFQLANLKVTRAEVSDWLKKDTEPTFKELPDVKLAIFLNGLIIEKRGKKDGKIPIPENHMNNNIILRKLKIALDLKSDEIADMFSSIDKRISEHELNAFLRNPKQSKYRPCNDQYLRNFLEAIEFQQKNLKIKKDRKPAENV